MYIICVISILLTIKAGLCTSRCHSCTQSSIVSALLLRPLSNAKRQAPLHRWLFVNSHLPLPSNVLLFSKNVTLVALSKRSVAASTVLRSRRGHAGEGALLPCFFGLFSRHRSALPLSRFVSLSLCIWITRACPSLDAPPEVKSPLIYYIRHVSVSLLAGRISPLTNSECSSKPKPCHVCVLLLLSELFHIFPYCGSTSALHLP